MRTTLRHVAAILVLALSAPAAAQDQAPDTPSAAEAPEPPDPRRRARELGLTRSQRELSLRLARTSFSEAGPSEADAAMMWQILGEMEGVRSQLAWLASHSPCVAGTMTQDQARERPGNCEWARNLMPDGRRPRGWITCRDEDSDGEHDDPDCHGRWSNHRGEWLTHLQSVIEYVGGVRSMIPCPVPPTTWDGPRWRDDILERGFVDLECKGTRNLGLVHRRELDRLDIVLFPEPNESDPEVVEAGRPVGETRS